MRHGTMSEVIDRIARIDAPGMRSLCWVSDTLVDWVGGGRILHLDGQLEKPRVIYAFRFDSSVASPCGDYAVIYEKLGTKGLVLRGGEVVREINRSFYHAGSYEYPIAIFQAASGQVILAHCPDEYCRLELEDIVTGERMGGRGSRKPPDFFHSRLRVSPNGRWLLSAGWVWHPFGMVKVFDLDAALRTSEALDQAVRIPEFNGEVAAAEFLRNDHLLIATSEETLDDDASEEAIGASSVAIVDLAKRQVILRSPTSEPMGSLMPVDDEVAVSFFEHPKLISLRTGAVLKRWKSVKSGNQVSSILLKGASAPPIAIDVPHRRFAVADASSVAVVDLPRAAAELRR